MDHTWQTHNGSPLGQLDGLQLRLAPMAWPLWPQALCPGVCSSSRDPTTPEVTSLGGESPGRGICPQPDQCEVISSEFLCWDDQDLMLSSSPRWLRLSFRDGGGSDTSAPGSPLPRGSGREQG